MTTKANSLSPTVRETSVLDPRSGKPYVVALEAGTLRIWIKGSRNGVHALPYDQVYTHAATLSATRLRNQDPPKRSPKISRNLL